MQKNQVAIPIWVDQKINGIEIEKLGIGINLNYATINEEILMRSLQKVLKNPSYAERAAELSDILTDQIDKYYNY